MDEPTRAEDDVTSKPDPLRGRQRMTDAAAKKRAWRPTDEEREAADVELRRAKTQGAFSPTITAEERAAVLRVLGDRVGERHDEEA